MIQIKYPLVLIILLLPYLVYYFWPLKEPNRKPIRLPSVPIVKNRSPKISLILVAVAVLSYICLTVAASRPVYISDPVLVSRDNYSIMMAVDVSPSMDMQDMQLGRTRMSRLQVLKQELKSFVNKRTEDDFGLIVFAEKAFIMSPVTKDHALFNSFVDELETNLAGSITSISDAVILAGQTLAANRDSNRVLILLTDGRDTSTTRVSTDDIISYALSNDMKVYTIGFGAMNNNATEQIDVHALRLIAEETGGAFFRAQDPEALSQVYANISAREPRITTEKFFQNAHELYYIPLFLSLLLSFVAAYLVRRHYE
ncbi:MAG: VWA domain-containing protein [Succinivibrionaceae bacterium]|nr:VWA domain-containing protein [Succinivibrionaceae bacterium]